MTPAILLVRKAKIAHDVLSYEHDPAAESYGREAVDLLQLEPATVFKTLVADAEGVGLVCAVVPVLMMLDLKALADDDRKTLLDDIRRMTINPTMMAYPDQKYEWGGG
jgi:Cys-tRNA(Pro)/Cys-tRNA(Cys) deacylase